MSSPRTIEWIYLRPWWLTPTTTPRFAACWSPGTSSTTSPHSTGRGVYFARTLRCTTDLTVHSSGYCVVTIIHLFLFPLFLLISLVSYLLGCTRLCPTVMLNLLPPAHFLWFCYVVYLKIMRFLSSCTRMPHVTTSSSDCPLYLYMHICKCQLLTDEGSRRLPKCLNYCFSVLSFTIYAVQ